MIDPRPRHAAAMLSAAVLLTLAGCAADTPPVTGSQLVPTESVPAAPVAVDLATYQFDVEATATVDDEVERVDELTTAWAIDPCRPTDYPTDTARSQFAGAVSFLGDAGRFTQLAQYPDDATASEVLAGFARALESCGRLTEPEPAVGSDIVQWQVFDPAALGDESLTLQSTEYISEFGLPGIDVVVVRIGTLVLVVGSDSFYAGIRTDPERLADVTELATAEVTRLEAALAAN